MIVVVADDFSGAAELAGSAATLGYQAEVHVEFSADTGEFSADTGADIVVVDTDTRSDDATTATTKLDRLSRSLQIAGIPRVFLKVDSVLRGHVALAASLLATRLGRPRILLAPANPSRGRIIRRGQYLIDNRPLDQTLFADDPEYPRTSADIARLLGPLPRGGATQTGSDKPENAPSLEWLMPDIESLDDIVACAARVDNETLPVGAADFFSAWLARHGDTPNHSSATSNHPSSHEENESEHHGTLLICGSPTAWKNSRARQCATWSIPTINALIDSEEHVQRQAAAFAATGDLVVTCGIPPLHPGESPRAILRQLADVALRCLSQCQPATVLMEGGATAGTFIRHLGIRGLRALPSVRPGIVPLAALPDSRPASLPWALLCKPGSYEWPAELWPHRQP